MTHLWISQPNWCLFYKYKKLLSQKQNLYVENSSQTNIFTTGFVCSNILCPEQGVSFMLSPLRNHVLVHPRTAMLLSWISDGVTIVAIDSEWKNVTQTKQRRDMRRHDISRDLTESRWFSFVNTTWLGPGPSLKWDSSKPSLESSLESRLLVNMAPGHNGSININNW